MKDKIAVIGSAGFIGQNFVEHATTLKYPVLPITRSNADLTKKGSELTLSSLLADCKSAVVLSALTPRKNLSPLEYNQRFMDNLRIAENIFSAVVSSSVSHILYVSTDAVYSEEVQDLTEDSHTNPQNFYGLAHKVRELFFSELAYKKKVTIIRPCAIFGTRDPHDGYGPNKFMREALAHKRISLFGKGEELRNHICVKDFVCIMLKFLEQGICGTYNVASQPTLSFMEMAKLIQKILPFSVDIVNKDRAVPIQHRIHHTNKFLATGINPEFTPLETSLKTMYKDMTLKQQAEERSHV